MKRTILVKLLRTLGTTVPSQDRIDTEAHYCHREPEPGRS